MSRRPWWLLVAAVAALAFAASANSIANGYTFDDAVLIPNSPRVHSWAGWWREFAQPYWPEGDGYRPLTLLGWRAQWSLGGGHPAVFHTVNVALHVATSVAMLWMASALLPLAAAWIAAALYAVHPVHVEAIANVVGQSELVVALLVVLAVGLYLHARSRGALSPRHWGIIGGLYGAACLFKEHAIMLPMLLALAEATVVRDAAPMRERFRTMRVPLLALCLVAAIYLYVRSRVFVDGFSGFQPFVVFEALNLSSTDRILTMVGVAPEWLRLLLWPARLSANYAPIDIDVAQGPSVSQLPGFLVLVGTLGLIVACWRKSPVTSFGVGWLVLTLLPASNFLLPAGFIIAERTLLLPSVGAMIALGSAVWWLYQRLGTRRAVRFAAAGVLLLGLGLGIARSYTRNRVWHDDNSLTRQGVVDSPNSYLAHFRRGLYLFSNQSREGEAHYRRAIALFPHDPLMAYSFAEQLRVNGQCDAAMPIYHWLFAARPDTYRGHLGYAACLLEKGRVAEAHGEALVWIQRGGRLSSARQILALARAGRDSMTARRGATR